MEETGVDVDSRRLFMSRIDIEPGEIGLLSFSIGNLHPLKSLDMMARLIGLLSLSTESLEVLPKLEVIGLYTGIAASKV